MEELDPNSLSSSLEAHNELMHGLAALPGQLRKGPIGVIRPIKASQPLQYHHLTKADDTGLKQ